MKSAEQIIEKAQEELDRASLDADEGSTEGSRLHIDAAYCWIAISREIREIRGR